MNDYVFLNILVCLLFTIIMLKPICKIATIFINKNEQEKAILEEEYMTVIEYSKKRRKVNMRSFGRKILFFIGMMFVFYIQIKILTF